MAYKDAQAEYKAAKMLIGKLEQEMQDQKELAMHRAGKKIALLLNEEGLSLFDLEMIATSSLRSETPYVVLKQDCDDNALEEQTELKETKRRDDIINGVISGNC